MTVIRETAAAATAGSGPRAGLLGRLAGRRPAAVRPPTRRGERVLVDDLDDGERAVLATTHALYRQPAPDADGDWQRWGWEIVHRVDWDAGRRTLTVRPLTAPASEHTVLRLHRGDRLAAFAAERVAASKLVDTWVVLGDGRRARVIGRCRPGEPEPLWIVSVAGGSAGAPTDELVTAAIARLRRSHGL